MQYPGRESGHADAVVYRGKKRCGAAVGTLDGNAQRLVLVTEFDGVVVGGGRWGFIGVDPLPVRILVTVRGLGEGRGVA